MPLKRPARNDVHFSGKNPPPPQTPSSAKNGPVAVRSLVSVVVFNPSNARGRSLVLRGTSDILCGYRRSYQGASLGGIIRRFFVDLTRAHGAIINQREFNSEESAETQTRQGMVRPPVSTSGSPYASPTPSPQRYSLKELVPPPPPK